MSRKSANLWASESIRENGPAKGVGSDKKKRHIPMAMIREIARNSNAGGRAFCDYCGLAFSANYVVPVGNWNCTKSACRDCVKELGLQKK